MTMKAGGEAAAATGSRAEGPRDAKKPRGRTKRRAPTRTVSVGGVMIGGKNPIPIQSMTNTNTADAASTIRQIRELEDVGCDIARVAVPNIEAARALGAIKKSVGIPIVADIHFDYRLALESIRQGVDKVRINPGNIGGRDNVKQVADAARARGIPIRVGVNAGSLDRLLLEKYGGATAEALVESALSQAEMLNMCGFYDIVISIKATDVFLTVDACRLLAQKKTGIPQHIGMTEAGGPISGTVKSTIGLYELLREGIGDTLRVSLTGDPAAEVAAAKELLRTLRLGPGRSGGGGVELISCPTCGRCQIDLVRIAEEVERRVCRIKTEKPIKVAVMGCAVNGPGEAREADLGIAGGQGKALLFKRGKPQYQVAEAELVETLMRELEALL
ncbi:MAG: flavodoxin-dependent (E)-4-hydroxy-3-methylbut-2-enyl-diphosphate synthase [Clostridiales bacterium]|jgi:(E)-4-hydroxy-3-methylbut-2-enyl-diphosphate synthase|nr:flavodoxin-dependent (E)-4-hydroxy-3-methylbut-2-enyl-diphosphate synthase [Clostridiales bacterium]